MLLVIVLVISFILGGAIAQVLLTVKRQAMEQSALVGWLACGDGMKIQQVPSGRGYRIACIIAGGREVGGRNNGAMLRLILPFFVTIAVPGCWLAWTVKLRRRPG